MGGNTFGLTAALALSVLACGPSVGDVSDIAHADVVYTNATVVTLDEDDTLADAIAVRDDEIRARAMCRSCPTDL